MGEGLTLQTSRQGCLHAQQIRHEADAGEHRQPEHPRWCHCWGTSLSPAHALLPVSPPTWAGSVLNPQHREGSTGMTWNWLPLSLAGGTPGSTRFPGRGTGLVSAPRLPGRALLENPSPLIPLHHPAPVPPAVCSAPTLLLPHPCPQSLIHSVRKEGDGTLPN